MIINLENYIGKTVEVELRNGDVWTGHKVKLDKLTFNQFKYLIGGGSDYYHKFGQHHQCNLYDIVKIRILKPDIIPHGQEKKMLDEKGHIQCEIEELKIEMQKQIDALKNCTKLVEKNNEKLRKLKMKNARYPMLEVIDENTVRIEGVKYQKVNEVNTLPSKPPTLLDIIREWNDDEDNPPCEVLADMIAEWLPKEYQSYSSYNEGWNDYHTTILENLK